MKVYLAARFARRDELKAVVTAIEARGDLVTSRWIKDDHKFSDPRDLEKTAQESKLYARYDLDDIDAADALIAFTDPPRVDDPDAPRGSQHVEFGYAFAKRKALAVLPVRENIFHFLPGVAQCADLDGLLRWLDFMRESIAYAKRKADPAWVGCTVERVHG